MSASKIGFSPAPLSRPISYAPGTKGFFQWMQRRNPQLYFRAMPVMRSANRNSLQGLGIADPSVFASPAAIQSATETPAPASAGVVNSIKDILLGVGQAYLTAQQVKAQQKVLDMQLKRAQSGLAPLDIDMAQYGLTPQAQVGLNSDTKTFLIWGGLIGAALLVFMKLK